MSNDDTKLFPYIVSLYDFGACPPGFAAWAEVFCRTLDEAQQMAYVRVLHSSKDSICNIYHVSQRSKKLRQYYWKETEIVYK